MSRRREPELALAFSAEAWVEELHRFCCDHGGARVTQLVLDPALATEDRFDALVASARWPGLTPGLVDALHRGGCMVVGVYDDGPSGAGLLTSYGCDLVLDAATPPESMVARIQAQVETRPELPLPLAAPAEQGEAPVVCVGGPGGTGTTEVAIALAHVWSQRGARTVLLDADLQRPALAVRLALAREPNLLSLVDASEYGSVGAVSACVAPIGGLGVVVGLARSASRVPGAGAGGPGSVELGRAVAALQRDYDVVVVDAGSSLDPEPHWGEPARPAPQRMLVATADVLVLVGHGTPAGVVALTGWIAQTRGLAPDVPLHTVVNRAPRSRFRRAELAAEVAGLGAVSSIEVVRHDRAVRAAAWSGGFVVRGRWQRRISRLAMRAVMVTPARRAGRARRGSASAPQHVPVPRAVAS